MKVGTLNIGDSFYHKNCTYEVVEIDYVFTKAKKANNDGTNHFFLNSIDVHEADLAQDWRWENPNHYINDLRKQNND